MERAYMPPAEPPPLEHDTWGAPHPKAALVTEAQRGVFRDGAAIRPETDKISFRH